MKSQGWGFILEQKENLLARKAAEHWNKLPIRFEMSSLRLF
jgi:hypothetical protein